MPNYQNGKIYTIRSHETDEIYIGSTIETLAQRMAKHKHSMKRWKDGECGYTSSYEILKYPTCYIELLEVYPCNSRMELEKKEGEYIRSMECVNKFITGRTYEERKEQMKQYYQDNKDKILEQQKEYHLENKDKILEQKKQYRLENKDKINEIQNQKYKCECGGKYTKQNKLRHLTSKKHQAYIATLENN